MHTSIHRLRHHAHLDSRHRNVDRVRAAAYRHSDAPAVAGGEFVGGDVM
ncbi:MAG: hypothetical protein JO166_14615 [Deltaproteobacteria bacterium]|nr:hypothetical protein [Deltaproteobacteria bacterium]